ncbi:MAG: YfhO family protein [Bacteroidetes bacterium]|nr:YfhO family protein [Bacteroidota bacterium]
MKPPTKQKKKIAHSTHISEQGYSKRESSDSFFLYSFIIRKSFLIGITLVFALILIIFHNFLFANLYYLFKDIGSDSLNWTYPSFLHISEYLRTEGFPLWSFSQGMGQSVANSLNDPFSWLVYLAGAENLAYAMIWMEALKILVTAVLFYHFLRYWNLSGVATVIGTVLYSFSGFMVVGSGWTIFSTEACYLALLLLSFERLYKNGSWYLFPIAVLLITILQPFDLYLYGLFLFFYFFLRHFTSEEVSFKKFFKTLGQIILFGLLGLMISCFFLVFFIQIIIDSPRIGGNSSYFTQLFSQPLFFTEKSIYYTTSILRLFHNDLVGNGSKFYGWYNYLEAPLFYIGIFPLLLFPQIFFLEGRRKKIGYAIFSGSLLFLLIFPFFRYAIWLFSGDYFRGFSLFISVPLLLIGLSAFSALDNGKKINPYILIATAVILILLLYFPYTGADQIIRSDIQSDVRNFIIVYTIINYHHRSRVFQL